MAIIKRFFKNEDGMELSEYAIVGGLLILAVVVTIGLWGDQLVIIFNNILANMQIAAQG